MRHNVKFEQGGFIKRHEIRNVERNCIAGMVAFEPRPFDRCQIGCGFDAVLRQKTGESLCRYRSRRRHRHPPFRNNPGRAELNIAAPPVSSRVRWEGFLQRYKPGVADRVGMCLEPEQHAVN